MVRILTVGNGYPPHHHGGYELIWQSAVAHLRAEGHQVSVLTTDTRTDATDPDPEGVYRELRWHLRDGRFEEIGLGAAMRMARHNHRALDRHLGRLDPDVVAWWSMGGLTLTMLESVRRRGLPGVAFVLDEWLDYGRWADPWTRTFRGPRRGRLARPGELVAGIPTQVHLGSAATYVFISEFTRRQALGLDLNLERTSVAHSGVNVEFIDPAPPREWAWELLYVGRIDERKGIDTAISVLPHLPEGARLTVAGSWDPREEARLREVAARLRVDSQVDFVGKLDRTGLIAAYGGADAVIFPVRWNEPWGLVPIEAMGRGRPVLATGRGGSGEYLRDGHNCLLFPSDHVEALAAAVRRLAESPSLRETLRAGGLETAARYTEPRYNREVEAALVAAAREPHKPRTQDALPT